MCTVIYSWRIKLKSSSFNFDILSIAIFLAIAHLVNRHVNFCYRPSVTPSYVVAMWTFVIVHPSLRRMSSPCELLLSSTRHSVVCRRHVNFCYRPPVTPSYVVAMWTYVIVHPSLRRMSSPCELLLSSTRHSVVCRKLSHLNLLLWNCWIKLSQVWLDGRLWCPLLQLCPTVYDIRLILIRMKREIHKMVTGTRKTYIPKTCTWMRPPKITSRSAKYSYLSKR